jgi:hypothetical protein
MHVVNTGTITAQMSTAQAIRTTIGIAFCATI